MLGIVALATFASPVLGADDFPLVGTYTENQVCKADSSDSGVSRVKITVGAEAAPDWEAGEARGLLSWAVLGLQAHPMTSASSSPTKPRSGPLVKFAGIRPD
jgi:hypothetical protein